MSKVFVDFGMIFEKISILFENFYVTYIIPYIFADDMNKWVPRDATPKIHISSAFTSVPSSSEYESESNAMLRLRSNKAFIKSMPAIR